MNNPIEISGYKFSSPADRTTSPNTKFIKMKRICLIVATMLIGIQQAASQYQSDNLSIFQTDILPRFTSYFMSASQNESGHLLLSATDQYKNLSGESRKDVLDELVKSWEESFVIIIYDSESELWSWDSNTGGATRLDKWNADSDNMARNNGYSISKTALHPWFIYIGGQGQYSSDHQILAALNSRVGFYLLRDKWDFAWTLSMGASGIDSTALNFNINYGLMSKYYFPLRKIRLSPNVGIDVGNRVYINGDITNSSPYASALAGVSWFIGGGSLDLEFKIGDQFTTLLGYTFFPGPKKKKR